MAFTTAEIQQVLEQILESPEAQRILLPVFERLMEGEGAYLWNMGSGWLDLDMTAGVAGYGAAAAYVIPLDYTEDAITGLSARVIRSQHCTAVNPIARFGYTEDDFATATYLHVAAALGAAGTTTAIPLVTTAIPAGATGFVVIGGNAAARFRGNGTLAAEVG